MISPYPANKKKEEKCQNLLAFYLSGSTNARKSEEMDETLNIDHDVVGRPLTCIF